jgi:hypothetical protein
MEFFDAGEMGGVIGCWALTIDIAGPVILKSIAEAEKARGKLS